MGAAPLGDLGWRHHDEDDVLQLVLVQEAANEVLQPLLDLRLIDGGAESDRDVLAGGSSVAAPLCARDWGDVGYARSRRVSNGAGRIQEVAESRRIQPLVRRHVDGSPNGTADRDRQGRDGGVSEDIADALAWRPLTDHGSPVRPPLARVTSLHSVFKTAQTPERVLS